MLLQIIKIWPTCLSLPFLINNFSLFLYSLDTGRVHIRKETVVSQEKLTIEQLERFLEDSAYRMPLLWELRLFLNLRVHFLFLLFKHPYALSFLSSFLIFAINSRGRDLYPVLSGQDRRQRLIKSIYIKLSFYLHKLLLAFLVDPSYTLHTSSLAGAEYIWEEGYNV